MIAVLSAFNLKKDYLSQLPSAQGRPIALLLFGLMLMRTLLLNHAERPFKAMLCYVRTCSDVLSDEGDNLLHCSLDNMDLCKRA